MQRRGGIDDPRAGRGTLPSVLVLTRCGANGGTRAWARGGQTLPLAGGTGLLEQGVARTWLRAAFAPAGEGGTAYGTRGACWAPEGGGRWSARSVRTVTRNRGLDVAAPADERRGAPGTRVVSGDQGLSPATVWTRVRRHRAGLGKRSMSNHVSCRPTRGGRPRLPARSSGHRSRESALTLHTRPVAFRQEWTSFHARTTGSIIAVRRGDRVPRGYVDQLRKPVTWRVEPAFVYGLERPASPRS